MKRISLEKRDWYVVLASTVAGTLFCILFALAIDYPHFISLPPDAMADAIRNDILIPGLLCPMFFSFLTWKIRQLEIAKRELEILASTDSLTKIFNRRAFTEQVSRGLEGQLGASLSKGAMLVIDVDHFKAVNDSYGHDRGDEALRMITNAIAASLRSNDVVGRLGGEEFGVFLPWIDLDTAHGVADRICRAVRDIDFKPAGEQHPLSVSIGIAMSDGHGGLTTLYKCADQALYVAKNDGRNRFVAHPGVQFAA